MAAGSSGGRLSDRVIRSESAIHGYGCFARLPFAAGDYIGTYRGREVDCDGPHVLWIYDEGLDRLSALEGNNLLRWLNHSDTPNALLVGLRLFALAPIASGDEITIDYCGGSGAIEGDPGSRRDPEATEAPDRAAHPSE